MIPWDFGIINAIKDQLGMWIFPMKPSVPTQQNPMIIFELKGIVPRQNNYRVEFLLTLVDRNEGKNLEVLKKFMQIIRTELTLKQGEYEIGSARTKIEFIDSSYEKLVIHCTALLSLKQIYEDATDETVDEN